MGAISGAGLIYGAARGMVDGERMDREEKAFESDQAIRTAQLDEHKAQAPLRRRALELGVENAEHQQQRRGVLESREDTLAQLNIDTAQLTHDEKKKAIAEADEAKKKQKRLREGLARFTASADPSHVAAAIQEIYPDFQNVTATRNEDGTITAKADGVEPFNFKGRKWEDGSSMTPDDEFGMFAYKILDPIKDFEKRWGHAMAKDIEGEKTNRAVRVAGTRAAALADRSERTRSQAWFTRQHSQIKPVLDSMLKTKGMPGEFIAGYAHENDAALRGLVEQRVEAMIEDEGVAVREASNTVINEVRQAYQAVEKAAKPHAQALAKKKISPRDVDAVKKAAAGGDADAKALLRAIATAEKHLGPSVATYLHSTLPAR